MQKGHVLEFKCLDCKTAIPFSLFDLEAPITCPDCGKQYAFTDATLQRQLKKFEGLCRQIHESEEILGNTSVGIDVGDHHVNVPYKLLLARLTSSLDLMIGDHPLSITFRMEPAHDIGTS